MLKRELSDFGFSRLRVSPSRGCLLRRLSRRSCSAAETDGLRECVKLRERSVRHILSPPSVFDLWSTPRQVASAGSTYDSEQYDSEHFISIDKQCGV